MSDALAQVGQFLGSGTGKGVMEAGVAGGGFLQNLMANREASKKQKFVENLITNPAKFQQFVTGFEKPLSQGLTADVARTTDAYGAERGLGNSGPIMKDVYAQALAPFVQQQKDQATQAALQSLGIYENSPTQKPMDVSSLLKAIMMQGGGGGTNPTQGIDLNTAPQMNNVSPFLSGPLPTPTVGGDTGVDMGTYAGFGG